MRRSALRPQSFRQRMPVLHLLHPKILSCTHQLHGGTVDCACAPGHGPSLQQQRLLDFCCGTGRWQRLRSDPDLSGAQLQQADILPCDATYPMRICQQSDICLLAIPSHSQKGNYYRSERRIAGRSHCKNTTSTPCGAMGRKTKTREARFYNPYPSLRAAHRAGLLYTMI